METARSLEERLRDVAGEGTSGMLIANERGKVIFADNAAEIFFGCKQADLAGRPLIGVLAGGNALVADASGAGGRGAQVRVSEIQWEGEPAYLAVVRETASTSSVASLPLSELHFRDIVQYTPDVILVNRSGKVVYVNDAGIKLLKADSAAQIIGRESVELFAPEFRDEIRARRAPLLKSPGVAPIVEQKLLALDGTRIDVEVRAISFVSRGEMAIQLICRDISERKASERALRMSVDRFHQLAEAMPQIVWTSTPGSGIDYTSRAFFTYTGLDKFPEGPVGLRWLQAVHPDDSEAAAAARISGQQGGVPYTMEFRVRRHDGEYRWHLVTASPVRDEEGVLVKWFGTATDVHDQRVAEQKADQLAARLLGTLESIGEAFVTFDRDWRVTYMNKAAERLWQISRQEMLGVEWRQTRNTEVFMAHYRRALEENRLVEFDAPYKPLDVWVRVRAFPSDGGLAVYFQDITEKRELEGRLRQAQRMEAIGQLTGGIAHDFNNLLTVIMGNAETLVERLSDPTNRKLAEMTMLAAERGSELTNRLLAFARRQALDPKAVDANALVSGMDTLMRRALGEHVEVATILDKDLAPAFVDAAQLEAALLNLCINARDAMPNGGKLTIETASVTLDDSYARGHEEVQPGSYVMVAVSDTGCGMSPRVAARAFEPFFTTKEVGKGTGLGLSMVHGFVKQSGGHVKIYTEEGQGTTVKLYVPQASEADGATGGNANQKVVGGSERILLVEDDGDVRRHVAAQVAALGYKVVAVGTAAEALAALDGEPFDLLFTDVVMPGGMNGPQLAREVLKRVPNMRVLFTSGYTENAIVHQGRLDPGVLLLNKPYRRNDLAFKIRQALASAAKV